MLLNVTLQIYTFSSAKRAEKRAAGNFVACEHEA